MRRAMPYPCMGPRVSRVFSTINASVPCHTSLFFCIWESHTSMPLLYGNAIGNAARAKRCTLISNEAVSALPRVGGRLGGAVHQRCQLHRMDHLRRRTLAFHG